MTYWSLNAIFLGAAAITAALTACLALLRAHRRRTRAATSNSVIAILATLVLLLIVTAIFDNVMIGVGLVGYDPAKISGVFIGIAPLEDFAYAVAAAVVLPSLWMLLDRSAGPDQLTESREGDR